ncbi:MAG: RluA family pseudouridine synthase [Bacilli bacterium]|nr:RluA family pseudouridine synthase [Bacilli bacterium]
MIDIIYEDNHLLVVKKPINVLVQADNTKDEDMLTILKKYLKEKYDKPGNVYLGLVHRLDRPVSGIMVFAKTSKAASRLSEQVKNRMFKKTYLAVVTGKVKKRDVFIDKLIKDHKNNVVKVSSLGKQAELTYDLIDYKDGLSLVEISLKTGRSHQIRVQFASRGFPLYGDQKYNKNTKKDSIALFAKKIEFVHPTTKKKMIFELDMPDRYPFSLFKECKK